MTMPRVSKRLHEARVYTVVAFTKLYSLTRYHLDLEMLLSQWSFKTHNFVGV